MGAPVPFVGDRLPRQPVGLVPSKRTHWASRRFHQGSSTQVEVSQPSFLKAGGRLVAIASAGLLFRVDRRTEAFRRLVTACDGSVTPIPDGSFRASSTEVRTVLITFDGSAGLVAALEEP